MENQNIDELIRLFARRQATPEQVEMVKKAIMDDTSLFTNLMMAMRHQSMEELNLDPADDFLPEHLKKCCPDSVSQSPAFCDDFNSSVSACIESSASSDIFTYLCKQFLG